MAKKETRTGGRDATDSIIPGQYALSIGMPSIPAPAGFAWRQLTDIARMESGHTPSRSHPEYWNGNIPWIGIRDATGNHGTTITQTNQYISELGVENSSTRILPTGTVCLSRTASVGYTIIMGAPMATSQDFINWVCGPELSSSYLRYVLMLEQESIRKFSYGTTHQTLYYPDAKALHICIPSRIEQDRTARVLGALDDKIATNQSLADTCERLRSTLLARATHSETSTRSRLSDVTSLLTRGITPAYTQESSGIHVLNQKCVRNHIVDTSFGRKTEPSRVRTEKVLIPNDVLVNSTGMGTLGRAARWTSEIVATADSHITIVRFDPAIVDPVVAGTAILALESEIEAMAEGSTGQTELSRAMLGSLEIELPSRSQQAALGRKIAELDGVEATHRKESRLLAKLRDTLLPHLMSGRLRVKDAERQVEAVV